VDAPRTAYTDGAAPAPDTAPLAGDVSADIAIVGGGFTGLSAALHAAQAGARVVVLEANTVGFGASGRNFGQVVPYLRQSPAHALRTFGAHWGERLIQAAAAGPDLVFDLIARHGIECHAVRNGLIFAAHKASAVRMLEDRAAFWQARGVTLPMLSRDQVAAMVGGADYPGAQLEPRGGTINSLGYARGLARAALAAGATIHTATRARALDRDGARWQLTAEAGRVTADRVLLCTNAYTDDLWPGLARTVVPARLHQLATKPLTENVRRTILPGGQAVSDTRHLASAIRLHPDGRLHMSAEGSPFGDSPPNHERALRRLRAMFPQLGDVAVDFFWSGLIAVTPDQYPRLYEPAPGILAGNGYSGRGIALATMMGRELAKRARGAGPEELLFPISPLRPLPFPAAARAVVRGMVQLYRFQDALETRGSRVR
jgi:glycine/D-amino acid oxidase-like deaminating enzyme